MIVVIVETAYPINSRTERFYQSITKEFGVDSVKVICWDRDGRSLYPQSNYYVYNKDVGYGNHKAKLSGLSGFYTFIKKHLIELEADYILASHWDSLVLSAMAKPKSTKLIYENLDMPSGNLLLRNGLRIFEKLALSKTDCITFASRFFVPQYDGFKGKKILIENKLPKAMCLPLSNKKKKSGLTISFLGVVRHATIMENLMIAISDIDDVEFKIFGGGPFFDNIKQIADKYSNVTMYGAYDYESIPEIYAQSDLIWAVYPYHDYNVKLAISNKYHETLHFGVPGIFCKGTKLGDMVASEGIGLAVDCDSIEEIHNVILNFKINRELLSKQISDNITRVRSQENSCWEEEIAPFIKYLER
jgi:hypothetical protein